MTIVVTFAAGGTAGHVEPALAVARELSSHGFNGPSEHIDCQFIGTKGGIEKQLVVAAGFQLNHISKVTLPRKISLQVLIWPFRWINVLSQTYRLVRGSDVLIGFGGYVSAPCYVVARLLRIPIVVHEQNAQPGWANRLGAYLTSNIVITFVRSRRTGKRWSQAKLVGLPLRDSILSLASADANQRKSHRDLACKEFGLDPSLPVLLIFGGSLGAERINQSVAEALPNLLERDLQIIHAVGRSNKVPASMPRYVPLAYLENMAQAYAASDLILARSGAATCVEIATVQNYAVLVPLAVGNGEQRANAEELVGEGAAEILDNSHLTGEWLSHNIERLILKATLHRDNRQVKIQPNAALLMAELVRSLARKSLR
jgi:UDP-N-acetylglucosamine--N-acetylmuramyl-(pentapeptide) pyrophosphoryl-undecaprenol N-acetylglucosamine transferase